MTMPSELAAAAADEAGVIRIPLPVPVHEIGSTNAYLVRDDQLGHVLVDPGAYRPELPDGGLGELSAALGRKGIRLGDIRAVLVTHPHIDHYGLTGHVLPSTGGELWMHAAASLDFYAFRAPARERERLCRVLRMHGVEGDDIDDLAGLGVDDWAPYLHSVVEPTLPLWGGEQLTIGTRDVEVVHTPGHSRSHICLWSPTDRLLISGDHLLPGITPPINFHHGIDDDPLGQYLDGLARIEALDPALVLPGHGRPFAGGGRRASAIRQSKLRRVQAVQEVLSGEPLTVKQITAQVYVKAVRTFQLRMAMTEVLGIVGYLRKRDLVEQVSDPGGITRFASTVRR
jgi:glyoxylase-like metal-dependent hydrolase (beta-lactamase superfamily II)